MSEEQKLPDVGEGWRLLGPDEVLQEGDEGDIGTDETTWVPTQRVGLRVKSIWNRYRRRVTPEAPAPELIYLDSELGWTDDQRTEFLRSEVARLRSEVERLKAENAKLEAENEVLRMCKLQAKIDESKIMTEEWAETLAQTTVENERLKSEVERLQRAANSWERESVAHAEEVERLIPLLPPVLLPPCCRFRP